MFYLTTHSTHFIYGYMASDIWLRTILIVRERNVLFNDAYFYQAAITINTSNLFICFCSFDLSCPIREKDNFIENLDIVLSCLIK